MASAPTGDHSHGNRRGGRVWSSELQNIELFQMLLLQDFLRGCLDLVKKRPSDTRFSITILTEA